MDFDRSPQALKHTAVIGRQRRVLADGTLPGELEATCGVLKMILCSVHTKASPLTLVAYGGLAAWQLHCVHSQLVAQAAAKLGGYIFEVKNPEPISMPHMSYCGRQYAYEASASSSSVSDAILDGALRDMSAVARSSRHQSRGRIVGDCSREVRLRVLRGY